MASTVLVFGAGGQVGCHLLEIAASARRGAIGRTHAETDICDPVAVGEAIDRAKPSVIVNAAAYTAVDKAESDTAKAFAVNRDGAAVVAKAAADSGIPLMHLSTDYVFDGTASRPYREDDPVGPQGAYARSKEAGERAVAEACERHLILRTAWVYGPFGANFLRTMLRLGAEREELGIVDDQTGCPTMTGDIAAAILAMVETAASGKFRDWGIYHYVGADVVTWYGFAGMIFAEAEAFGRKAPRLRPIGTADYPTPAPRPAYSVLSTAKIERVFGIRPAPLHGSVIATLKRLLG
jgi:dTDP-4-dehydrorhamnose reductase